MKHIFYLVAIVPLIDRLVVVFSPVKTYRQLRVYKLIPIKKYEDLPQGMKDMLFYTFVYLLWCFVGMFTFQGPVFFVLLLLHFFAQIGLKTRFVCAVLTVLLIAFAIFNSYYLKINVFKLIGLHHG
jgi:hypothetical protein